MKRLALIAGLIVAWAACTDDNVLVQPVIDSPDPSDDGALPPLDEILFSVAHQGHDEDILQQTFGHGKTIQLANLPFADDLVVHMTGRVGSGDAAYGRTCFFAVTPNGTPPTPHLFFSRSVKFATLPWTPQVRTGGHAITFHDGSGLVIGGSDPTTGTDVQPIERFDPVTGEPSIMGQLEPRHDTAIAALGSSRVLVTGGVDGSGAAALFYELIEDRVVERMSDTKMARIGATATSLTDGTVVVIGGAPPSMPPTGELDVVSLGEGAVAVVNQLRAALATPRTRHTATRLGDDVGAPVLIVGGVDATGQPVKIAELFKPLSQDLAGANFKPMMVVPRTQHQAVLMPDRSVLIIGGIDGTGALVPTLERFTIDAGFVSVGDLPATAGLIDFTATTLPDGRILLAGGRATLGGPAVASAWIIQLDPLTGHVDVLPTDDLGIAASPTPRAGHQATLMCDGTVLITGGTPDAVPAERYNPISAGRR